MSKKYELLAKYFADLSKIIFATTVIKQFIEQKVIQIDLFIGIFATLILVIVAYFVQPGE